MPPPVPTSVTDAPPPKLDSIIEWLLIALLIFMPLAMGVVHPWSEMVVIAVVAIASTCLSIRLITRQDIRFVWSWTYLLIALFLLLAVFQLLPLPTSVIQTVAPWTAETKNSLAELTGSTEPLRSMSLSFYPHSTKHDLRILLAISAVFIIVLNVHQRPSQIKRLLGAISIVGGGVALIALMQVVTGAERIYGLIETSTNRVAGTFVNYNNFSQFMNLSIGAALALLLVHAHETRHQSNRRRGSDPRRFLWPLIGVISIGAAAIVLTMSRVGAIALLIAGALTGAALSLKRFTSVWGWVLVGASLITFAIVLYVGFDRVYDRIATLSNFEEQYDLRWLTVRDIAANWHHFWTLGTGLGTHQYVFPMFDQSTSAQLAAYAENEYVQVAEEMGVAGLLLVLTFAAVVGVSFIRSIRRMELPIQTAVYGIGFGLLAIMIHSFSDFGQHQPANACLTAAFCALLLRLSSTPHASEERMNPGTASTTPIGTGFHRRFVPSTAAFCLIVIWSWCLLGAESVRAGQAHWNRALVLEQHLEQNDWEGSNAEYAELIEAADKAASADPDNVEHRHWLNVYRWRSISRVHDPETGNLVLPDRGVEFTRRIVSELDAALRLCPTFGPAHSVAGQLQLFVLGDARGAERIRRGYELTPHSPLACFLAGTLDAIESDLDASQEKFGRTLDLNAQYFFEIAEIYVQDVGRPDLAVALAGDSPRRLRTIIRLLDGNADHQDLVKRLRQRTIDLLQIQAASPDASPTLLATVASMCMREGDLDTAIKFYRMALALNYGQVQWRFDYARALAEQGNVGQAIEEARVCLRLRPQMEAARKFIAELSVR